MSRQTRKLLHDALTATENILKFTEDLTYRTFSDETIRQKATYYEMAVLGEALSKLAKVSPEITSGLSDTRSAIDMRNRLIHGYSSVDAGIVWSTIEQDIPNLRDELQALLDDELDDKELYRER